MEPYQLIDDEDQPKNPKQRAAMISRCAELIERTKAAITAHRQYDKPDLMAIGQYEELQTRYIQELAELLQPLDLVLQFSPGPDAPQRIAA
jgi:hypothetical protein